MGLTLFLYGAYGVVGLSQRPARGRIFVVMGEAVVNVLNKAMAVFNITLRSAFIVLGVLMLVGYFPLPNVDPKFRMMFGVVFILYGLFRMVTLFTKGVQRRTL